MKKLFIIAILLTISCDKEDQINGGSALTHAELGIELDEPDIILNELASAELDSTINSVFLLMYGNTERKWEFEYRENSNQLSKMTFYLPHYQTCEKEVLKFNYNAQNLIETVIETTANLCGGTEFVRTYTFNYNSGGLLKSIFMDSEYFLEENYFAYYPNGKIKEIYNDFHGRGEEPSFGIQRFTYDDSFTNVTQVEHINGSNYHYTYKYFYDTNQNPFKDVFIAVSVFMPFIGPAYLSENNVIQMIKKNENVVTSYIFTYDYSFNYSSSNSLINYEYSDGERVYYINH